MEGNDSKPYPVENPTTSFWLSQLSGDPVQSLHSVPDNDVDVAIIGSGMAGISTCYWLSQSESMKNSSILVIDARGVSEGATGRNGGHCWPSSIMPEDEQIDLHGFEALRQVQKFKFDCAKSMVEFIKQHNIDCDLVDNTGAIEVARFDSEVADLNESVKELNEDEMNFGNAYVLTKEDAVKRLHSDPSTVQGALLQPGFVAQFFPAKFVRSVAKMAEDSGVKFLLRTMVQKVEKDSNGIHLLHTSRGICRARKIVFATNGYSAAIAEVAKDWIFPVRGQVVATSPQSSWLFPSNICINDGYEYMIQRKSDQRIILGGMRWRSESPTKEKGVFDDSTIDPNVSKHLRVMFSEVFTQAYPNGQNPTIEHEWTGIMGFTKDGLPLIGPIDADRTEYILAGFCGNGMVRCWAAGEAIANMITGKLEPENWIKPFLPSRLSIPELADLRQNPELETDGE